MEKTTLCITLQIRHNGRNICEVMCESLSTLRLKNVCVFLVQVFANCFWTCGVFTTANINGINTVFDSGGFTHTCHVYFTDTGVIRRLSHWKIIFGIWWVIKSYQSANTSNNDITRNFLLIFSFCYCLYTLAKPCFYYYSYHMILLYNSTEYYHFP